MKKLLRVLILGLLPSSPALAQRDYPRVEISGAYSYLRTHVLFEPVIPKGWSASIVCNLHRNFGIETNVSGHYGRDQARYAPDLRHDYSSHFFMFGGRYAQRFRKVTLWAHALLGASHARVEGRVYTMTADQRTLVVNYGESRRAHAWAVGGGFDVDVYKHFAIRLVQADYVDGSRAVAMNSYWGGTYYTLYYSSGRSNNLRLSFGVLWK
jgi:hypothetical protein